MLLRRSGLGDSFLWLVLVLVVVERSVLVGVVVLVVVLLVVLVVVLLVLVVEPSEDSLLSEAGKTAPLAASSTTLDKAMITHLRGALVTGSDAPCRSSRSPR